MVKRFVPDVGDIIWVNLDPTLGHEQNGYRPAVVLSPFAYNNKVGLLLCVPCTTKEKGYPFEVKLSNSSDSYALADQITSIDWRARKVTKNGNVTPSELEEIRGKLNALLI